MLEKGSDKRKTPEYKEARRKAQNESRKDPIVRLRHNISVSIRQAMKNPKMKTSISEHLDWSSEDLIRHIEAGWSLPENLTPEGNVWMSWQTYGKYNRKTWIDDDYSTHTWNIDHIIPQNDLLFYTMEDENFKKCWALDNLRPYSAKQNNTDGVKRTRHKRKINNER